MGLRSGHTADTVHFSGRVTADEPDERALEHRLMAEMGAPDMDALFDKGLLALVGASDLDGLDKLDEDHMLVRMPGKRPDALLLLWDKSHEDEILDHPEILEGFVEQHGRPVLSIFLNRLPEEDFPEQS